MSGLRRAAGASCRPLLAIAVVAHATLAVLAVAAALLKLASLPPCPAVAAASPARDLAGSLEARITQLEDRRPPEPRLARGRLLGTAGNLTVLMAAGLCCARLSQALPAGML
jgi:hypothetical protein